MSRLFLPLEVGQCRLQHRVALAPLTRLRALERGVPSVLQKEYYAQRASVPGTLLVSESTAVSPDAASLPHQPGIYSGEQIAAWREITNAVHTQGSYIYLQLWHAGRVARPGSVVSGVEIVSASAVPVQEGAPVPRALPEDEIAVYIGLYRQAALNAIDAKFDGVEIHGANGFLIDQFTQDVSNRRNDAWGGSVENHARFGLEVTKAVVDAIGADRVGYRVSPFGHAYNMGMSDPVPQFRYLVQQLKKLRLAYLHVIEARVSGPFDQPSDESVDFLVGEWDNTSPVLLAGGYNSVQAEEAVNVKYADKDVVIAFGRHFISNPDLPFRIKESLELKPYIRELFYTLESPDGYTDYPFSSQWLERNILEQIVTTSGVA